MKHSDFYTEEIQFRSPDGTLSSPFSASFGRNDQGGRRFRIREVDVRFDEKYLIERSVPGGRIEEYEIVETRHSSGKPPIIPPSQIFEVEKIGSKTARQSATTININQADAVQIGDHNVQQIGEGLRSLIEAIDRTDVPEADKADARNRIEGLLTHPAVVAVVGGGAGELARQVFGG